MSADILKLPVKLKLQSYTWRVFHCVGQTRFVLGIVRALIIERPLTRQ